MQLVMPAAIAGSRLLVNNEINRQLNAQRQIGRASCRERVYVLV